MSQPNSHPPKAFLSYAFEDSALAKRIAVALQSNGIDTWWAEWCMAAGDSIRQRIDEGLGACTHFLVLLTPVSLEKPWVRQEMDAGLVRKLSTGTKFVAIRCDVAARDLPPLLQGMISPEIDVHDFDVAQLVNDIHGISRKPPLGSPPITLGYLTELNAVYSPTAIAVAKLFVQSSLRAKKIEQSCSMQDLVIKLGLSEEDVDDAVAELRGLVTMHAADLIYPEAALFVSFDKYWMGWNPAEDALRVAAGLVNDNDFPDDPKDIATLFDWTPRRLNPALEFLAEHGYIKYLRSNTGEAWSLATVARTAETRRFVKSR